MSLVNMLDNAPLRNGQRRRRRGTPAKPVCACPLLRGWRMPHLMTACRPRRGQRGGRAIQSRRPPPLQVRCWLMCCPTCVPMNRDRMSRSSDQHRWRCSYRTPLSRLTRLLSRGGLQALSRRRAADDRRQAVVSN
ncbi:hypothetical protein LX32DRAFT_304322 [Colletotrichum zoysiae]|uniref:Uncharacterized protein n=1 Tax=Colletotrichum zoysiae TaxID=1216348 RepID=A0AAD9H348_9PEZI|nr:hypothetical protein LX32DRAFT_304322 [Colletotrichum zoysiae]